MLLVLMCAGWQEYISPALNSARSTHMFSLKLPCLSLAFHTSLEGIVLLYQVRPSGDLFRKTRG